MSPGFGFAALAAGWWVAIWGLVEVLTERWGRETRTAFYGSLFLLVMLATLYWPDLVERF